MLFVPKTRRRSALRRHPDAAVGAAAVGAGALGTLAVGALAFGALAIGALAVCRLTVRDAKFKRLRIDELDIGQLRLPASTPRRNADAKREDTAPPDLRDERDATAPERQNIERADEGVSERANAPDNRF